jgi:hypothetical protein
MQALSRQQEQVALPAPLALRSNASPAAGSAGQAGRTHFVADLEMRFRDGRTQPP